MPIDITQSLRIPGWMTYDELMWLAKQAQRYITIVEIGSYLGRSTRALADNAIGKVLALDNWYGPTGAGNSKPSTIDKAVNSLDSSGQVWTDEEREHLFTQFSRYLEDHINSGKVVPIKCDHRNITIDVNPDMVFIDGSHTHEDVAHDLDFWWPRLRPGGLLSGHDVNQECVAHQVLHRFGKYSNPSNTTIWWVEKKL